MRYDFIHSNLFAKLLRDCPYVCLREARWWLLDKFSLNLNSLWPSDARWRHRSESTLVQVMAWCHQATSHYLNQCWPNFMTPYGITMCHNEISWEHYVVMNNLIPFWHMHLFIPCEDTQICVQWTDIECMTVPGWCLISRLGSALICTALWRSKCFHCFLVHCQHPLKNLLLYYENQHQCESEIHSQSSRNHVSTSALSDIEFKCRT